MKYPRNQNKPSVVARDTAIINCCRGFSFLLCAAEPLVPKKNVFFFIDCSYTDATEKDTTITKSFLLLKFIIKV